MMKIAVRARFACKWLPGIAQAVQMSDLIHEQLSCRAHVGAHS